MKLYFMPSRSKYRVTNAGAVPNVKYHIARHIHGGDRHGELSPMCGSDNVEGPAEETDSINVLLAGFPFGTCKTCARLVERAAKIESSNSSRWGNTP